MGKFLGVAEGAHPGENWDWRDPGGIWDLFPGGKGMGKEGMDSDWDFWEYSPGNLGIPAWNSHPCG